jgi:hypothetical protein
MKKFLFVIARYSDWRQEVFEKEISPRNQEFADLHGYEYVVYDNSVELPLYRQNPTWWKFSVLRDWLAEGKIADGDIFLHLDADMYIVKIDEDYPCTKSFSYCIDSGNTHCMGNYAIKINEWSRNLVDSILDDWRFSRLWNEMSVHEAFGTTSSFWHEFREQASWYSLAGIQRHSWVPFWDLTNSGFHTDKNQWTSYGLDELKEHVELIPTGWNVTEMPGETDGRFLINKVEREDVIIRHFSGGQPWRINEWKNK